MRRTVGLPALRAVTCAGALLLSVPCPAVEATTFPAYPTRAIRIIVASSAGTAEDFFARALGEELGALYRQQIFVDNHAGAGGLIGNRRVSHAKADGYTLGMIGVTRMITELVRDAPPYRALGDIVGVAHVASITNVLVSSPEVPVHTPRQLVAYARLRPGELNYASLGIGSASHLAGEIFTRGARLDAVHVPFRRLTDSYVEMMRGRVHYTIQTLPAMLAPLRSNRLRALAVMTPQRSPALPDVPSIIEMGLPDAQFDRWSGIVAPKGTPRRIVEQLHGDITTALRKTSLRERFVRQGAESTPENTPDGFMRFMQEEYLRYQAYVRSGAITAEY